MKSPSLVGPNLERPVCLCSLAATCTLGSKCNSRLFHAHDIPSCYKSSLSEELPKDED